MLSALREANSGKKHVSMIYKDLSRRSQECQSFSKSLCGACASCSSSLKSKFGRGAELGSVRNGDEDFRARERKRESCNRNEQRQEESGGMAGGVRKEKRRAGACSERAGIDDERTSGTYCEASIHRSNLFLL